MKTVFFSWQSDSQNENRNFIEKSIKSSLKSLEKDNSFELTIRLDKDTHGLTGSPDIMSSIYQKIDKCSLFIADISNVIGNEKKSPNPNVLLETGYASKAIGWDRIICLFNSSTGSIEDVPFDLEHNRITLFDPNDIKDLKRIEEIITLNIKTLQKNGKFFNSVHDYMKMRIDKNMLSILKKSGNIFCKGTTMSEGLRNVNAFTNLSSEQIEQSLKEIHSPAFLFLDMYESTTNEVNEIIRELSSSTYYPRDWIESVIDLSFWLTSYYFYFSPRNYNNHLIFIEDTEYNNLIAVKGRELSSNNPKHSFIILENLKVKDEQDYTNGRVINITEFTSDRKLLCKTVGISPNYIYQITSLFSKLTNIANKWLDETDSEFILDPNFYTLKERRND